MKKYAPLLVLIAFLTACAPAPTATPTVTAISATPAATPIPPTPTPIPRSINICLGQEPDSLYIYASQRSQAMWSILEGIYDGPTDYVNYQYQPVILKKIPSLADGDAQLDAVTVKQGMDMVDADGNLRALQQGVPYFPSGCTTADCIQEYSGTGDIQMDQLTVHFTLKEGITWSDGTPLTAADSVFSFSLAGDPSTTTSKDLVKKTASYIALDDLNVEWKGIPGFMDQQYMSRFWIPLPQHLLGTMNSADIAESPLARRTPLGWGPYVIREWKEGDHITLAKNPAYFRASEGLPVLDTINFRFVSGTSSQSMEALLTGECDLVDESTLLDDQLAAIRDLEKAGKLKAEISGSTVWEGLYYGIKPALYDSMQPAFNKNRPDYFSDARTRKAVAMCIHRDQILQEVWAGYAATQNTFLSDKNPIALAVGTGTAYDPMGGQALLDQIGWKDFDQNPETPRVAVSVSNVYAGAPLTLQYYTTTAEARSRVAALLKSNLAQCGIGLEVKQLSPEELFAAGPEGVIFGRQFDLAAFSWSPNTLPGCRFYTSAQINTSESGWTGLNVSGYTNPTMDDACRLAAASLPGQSDYQEKQQTVQSIFAADLPVLPLYQMPRIAVSRPDLCNYQMDETSRSALWNIEKINYGPNCP